MIHRLLLARALRTTEERFRLAVEAALDYAILVSDPEDRITDWLPGAAAVFGWTAEEAIGQPSAIIFTPEDRENGQDRWEVETVGRERCSPGARTGYPARLRPRVDRAGSVLRVAQPNRVRTEADGVHCRIESPIN